MTCKDKLIKDYPGFTDSEINEILEGYCPSDYDYLPTPTFCGTSEYICEEECRHCWNREIPEIEKPQIKDSGERRQFETGAVRDIQEGRGRCDLMPLDVIAGVLHEDYDSRISNILRSIAEFQATGNCEHLRFAIGEFGSLREWKTEDVLLEVSKHFEEGAKKYGENNWQKGIPTHCYIDSAVRHYLKWLRGDKDEPHDKAFVWNLICCIWTCIHKPELNDYRKDTKDENN